MIRVIVWSVHLALASMALLTILALAPVAEGATIHGSWYTETVRK